MNHATTVRRLTRFVAYLLDVIILYILGSVVGFVFGFLYATALGTAEGVEGIAFVLGIVIAWLYFALLESSDQQATLGKQALGIIVTEGNKISFGRATGRHFSKFISSLIFAIGYIMAAFSEKKQALHDIIASTLVVKK
ncbi:MAG: RDD family protein [Gloeotrichia echinulata DVL01]|nr:RDD family protein [Gloeotrichia echinulata DEX184]